MSGRLHLFNKTHSLLESTQNEHDGRFLLDGVQTAPGNGAFFDRFREKATAGDALLVGN